MKKAVRIYIEALDEGEVLIDEVADGAFAYSEKNGEAEMCVHGKINGLGLIRAVAGALCGVDFDELRRLIDETEMVVKMSDPYEGEDSKT